MLNVPSIAQLVERRTVETLIDILRSLVRIRLEGNFFLVFFVTFVMFVWLTGFYCHSFWSGEGPHYDSLYIIFKATLHPPSPLLKKQTNKQRKRKKEALIFLTCSFGKRDNMTACTRKDKLSSLGGPFYTIEGRTT